MLLKITVPPPPMFTGVLLLSLIGPPWTVYVFAVLLKLTAAGLTPLPVIVTVLWEALAFSLNVTLSPVENTVATPAAAKLLVVAVSQVAPLLLPVQTRFFGPPVIRLIGLLIPWKLSPRGSGRGGRDISGPAGERAGEVNNGTPLLTVVS